MPLGRIYLMKICWVIWITFFFVIKILCFPWNLWKMNVDNLNCPCLKADFFFLAHSYISLLKTNLQYCIQFANIYVKCHLQVLTLKKEQKCTQVKLVLLSQKQEQLLMKWVCKLSLELWFLSINWIKRMT